MERRGGAGQRQRPRPLSLPPCAAPGAPERGVFSIPHLPPPPGAASSLGTFRPALSRSGGFQPLRWRLESRRSQPFPSEPKPFRGESCRFLREPRRFRFHPERFLSAWKRLPPDFKPCRPAPERFRPEPKPSPPQPKRLPSAPKRFPPRLKGQCGYSSGIGGFELLPRLGPAPLYAGQNSILPILPTSSPDSRRFTFAPETSPKLRCPPTSSQIPIRTA